MKRILLLIIILFGMTGCYDYLELKNRAIISGISIDLTEADEYQVNFEILNNKKSDSGESESNKVYLVEGKGKNISEAFQDVASKMNKEAYYPHLKVLVISEDVAKEKLFEVVDYLLREPTVRNIFYPVVAKNTTAYNILNSATKSNSVTAETIESMIESSSYAEEVSIKTDFEKFMDLYTDPRKDPFLTAIEKEENTLGLSGMALFESDKLVGIIDKEFSAIYNALINTSTNHSLYKKCESGVTAINLYNNQKTDFEIKDNTLTIKSKLNANVQEDTCGYNFRDSSIYENLNKEFGEIVKKEYEQLWKKISSLQSDVFGIQDKYWKKERKELSEWYQLELKTEIDLEINKNGYIFEVKKSE